MIPVGRYKHFKGGEYDVLGVASTSVLYGHSSPEWVVYRAVSTGKLWLRPPSEFQETVQWPDGLMQSRFVLVDACEVSEIKQALAAAQGNVTAAARTFNITRYSLLRRIRRYKLQEFVDEMRPKKVVPVNDTCSAERNVQNASVSNAN